MDDFTQRMVDRARQRAENLDKMCADVSPLRKRRSNDNTQEVIDDDSPNKRQCFRFAENSLKPDTPAIPSVKSRRAYLNENTDSNSRFALDENIPPVSSVSPSARKSRLAALAASINSWEDESSPRSSKIDSVVESTTYNKTSSAKQGFFSPVGSEAERSRRSPVGVQAERSRRSPVGVQTERSRRSPVNVESERSRRSPVRKTVQINETPTSYRSRSISPVKRTSPSKYSPDPHQFLTPAATDTSPVVSKLTVRLGGTPAKSEVLSSTSHEGMVSSTPASVVTNKASSSEDEPTATPIAARRDKWQQKSGSEISTPLNNRRNTPAPKSSLLRNSEKKRTAVDIIRQPVNLDESMVEVTNTPVINRKSLWEDKIAKSQKEVAEATGYVPGPPKPPRSTEAFKDNIKTQAKVFKTRRESMDKGSIISPIKSPQRVGQGTKSLHERLTDMKASWEKNAIATSMKEKRNVELEALQNRWKDGVLKEEVFRDQSADENINDASHRPTTNKTPAAQMSTPRAADKREIARDKARNDFENKLQSMGFAVTNSPALGHVAVAEVKKTPKKTSSPSKIDLTPRRVEIEEKKITTTSFGDNKVTVKAKTNEVPEHLVSCRVAMEMDDGERIVSMGSRKCDFSAPDNTEKEIIKKSTYSTTMTIKPNQDAPQTPTSGRSLYTLIKEQKSAHKTPVATDFQAPISAGSRSQPQYGLEDSFESDDSFGATRLDYDQDELTTETDTDYITTTTLSSSDNESVFRRPNNVDKHALYRGSVSSTQSDYTEYSDSQTDDYTADTCSITESAISESDSNAGGVSELLDELLDTETESERSAPTAAPRHALHSKQVGFAGAKNENLLRYQDSSDDERRGRLIQQQKNRTTWAEGMISSDIEDDQPLVYSLQMYRSTRNKSNRGPAKQTIVRPATSYNPAPVQSESYLSNEEIHRRIEELEEMIHQEQTKIMQTSNALNQCCGADSAFASSPEAVECHKILLIACKRHETFKAEIQRLSRGSILDDSSCPQGSLTISDIKLPLRQEFASRLGSSSDKLEHYFICLLRHNGKVIQTEMVSTKDAIVHGSLEFTNLIKLTDIQENFKLNLEVYGMHINIQRTVETPKKKKGTPKKQRKLALQSPGGPTAIRSSNFKLMSALTLSMNCLHKTHFSLDKMPYQAPLLGTIHLRLTCLLENTVCERGFLTMFEDVSGFGSWHRRWVALMDGRIRYWKYPDDEKTKDPMGTIDLKQCISEVIGLIPRDVCARPNSFEIVCVRRQQAGEKDSLVKRCYNTMATTRHWLSADTKEERLQWCDQLNEALRNLRTWHQDAMRPLKTPQK